MSVFAAPKPEPQVKKPKGFARLNPGRRKRAFKEAFGSRERCEWVAGMRCEICGVWGFTENAHVRRRSRGGKAKDIAPLCGDRPGTMGCHTLFDLHRLEEHRLRLGQVAKQLDARWNERGAP